MDFGGIHNAIEYKFAGIYFQMFFECFQNSLSPVSFLRFSDFV